MARETYDDLIFELADLAREHLANRPNQPRSMGRVFAAEDAVVAAREALEQLDAEINERDAAMHDFVERQEAEKAEQKEIVKKWRAAVAGVEGRSRDLRKKVSTAKATMRYERIGLKRAEARHKDLEQREAHDEKKISISRENLKKQRLHLMRQQRDIEEMEREFVAMLTPKPGQVGAPGILAHKRLLELEDEAEVYKAEHDERLNELDEAIAAKEEEEKAAQEYLDQALFVLGEEVYTTRLNEPALAPLYLRLDKAK